MKRARKKYPYKGKTIIRLPTGSYQISVTDSKGQWTITHVPRGRLEPLSHKRRIVWLSEAPS